MESVIIAGAGIGGLTLACALRGLGINVRVFEQAPRLAPLGAGITVQSNAMFALRAIGLDGSVASAGHEPGASALLDVDGRVLSRTDLRRVTGRVGAPSVALHRATLHKLLLAAADPAVVTTGAPVEHYEERESGIRVEAGAQTFTADLLVGADGLRSAVRKQLLGDSRPRYAGYTSWRGVCPTPVAWVERSSETWGRGERFGIVPIDAGQTYWFATANAPEGERDRAARTELLARFGGWHAPIRRLLEATPSQDMIRTDIVDRDPVLRWTGRRVALLGDAAHPMTPNLGQGGCQAIEDAVTLARTLSECATLEEALESYERQRVARANSVVIASRRLGVLAQWSNRWACALRSLLIVARRFD